jgi:hypothetical protein
MKHNFNRLGGLLSKKSRDGDKPIQLNFNKNLVDIISTVSDQIKPTYGVAIAGKGLKGVFDTTPTASKAELHNEESHKDIFATTIDDETGDIKIKALPYTQNPKLSFVTTRKDFLENGMTLNTRKPNRAKQRSKASMTKKTSQSNISKQSKNKTTIEVSPRTR